MSTVHHTYAQALYEAAREKGQLEQVHEELGQLVAAIEETPELREILRNPQLDPRAKADLVREILADADETVRNFAMLTAEKGRAGELEDIYRELDRLVAAEERRLNVELTTAFELSDDEARGIVGQIERASGRTVDATRAVDPSLIGGLVLQAGAMRVDASVRGRIERLRQELVTRS